jgi:hypothetical protein
MASFAVRGRFSTPLEVPCARLHPVHCATLLRAENPAQLVNVAMEHGARVHGFTPVWYSQERQNWMIAVATRYPGAESDDARLGVSWGELTEASDDGSSVPFNYPTVLS